MFNATQIELIMATLVVGIVILATRRTLSQLENINLLDLSLFFIALFFGVGPWIAFIYGDFSFYAGNKSYPPEPAGTLFKAYCVIILYIFGILFIKKALLRLRNNQTIHN